MRGQGAAPTADREPRLEADTLECPPTLRGDRPRSGGRPPPRPPSGRCTPRLSPGHRGGSLLGRPGEPVRRPLGKRHGAIRLVGTPARDRHRALRDPGGPRRTRRTGADLPANHPPRPVLVASPRARTTTARRPRIPPRVGQADPLADEAPPHPRRLLAPLQGPAPPPRRLPDPPQPAPHHGRALGRQPPRVRGGRRQRRERPPLE